jgi:hypothetical protein
VLGGALSLDLALKGKGGVNSRGVSPVHKLIRLGPDADSPRLTPIGAADLSLLFPFCQLTARALLQNRSQDPGCWLCDGALRLRLQFGGTAMDPTAKERRW